jgi:type I restriction enzyme S subunit
MKTGWKMVKLGEVCEILNGFAFKSKCYVDSGIRILRITNVQKGCIEDKSPAFYPFSAQNELGRYLLKENDILMSLTGNVGRVGVLGREHLPAALNQRVACLRVKKSDLDRAYLFHFLNSERFENDSRDASNGIAQMNLSTKFVQTYPIPLPPLEEQRRIVAVLDAAQELIDKRKEQLALMDQLTQSLFYTMFGDPVSNPMGWEVKNFGMVLNNIDSGWSPSCLASSASVEKWGVLKLSAVTGGIYRASENKELPSDVEPKLKHEVKAGDLLFTRKNTRELVGSCAFVYDTRDKLMMPDLIFRLDTTDEVEKIYVWGLFNNECFRENIMSLAGGSAASMINISKAKLKMLKIPLPSIALQQEFAERVAAIEREKAAMSSALKEQEDLFAALMQRAFKGEL